MTARIGDTDLAICATCATTIRRRGDHGRWVHIIDSNESSTVIEPHRATPQEHQ